jgi:hypothetical protein
MPHGSSGMGAMIPPTSGSTGGSSSGGAKYNPFLQGAGQGGQKQRGNSKDRGKGKEQGGNKKGAGPQQGRGSGGGVERRDRERSQVFSSSK